MPPLFVRLMTDEEVIHEAARLYLYVLESEGYTVENRDYVRLRDVLAAKKTPHEIVIKNAKKSDEKETPPFDLWYDIKSSAKENMSHRNGFDPYGPPTKDHRRLRANG